MGSSILVLLALSVGACTADGGTTAPPPEYEGPALSGTIAFEVVRDDRGLVWFDPSTGEGRGIQTANVGPNAGDGDRVVLQSQPRRKGAMVVVRDGPDAEPEEIGPGECPSWASNGAGIIATRGDELVRLGLDGSSEKVADVEAGSCGLEIGDGRFVVWSLDRTTIDVVDGAQSDEIVDAGDCGIGPVDYHSGNEALVFVEICDADDVRLVRYDFESDSIEPLISGVLYGASWSPSGQEIATAYRHDGAYFLGVYSVEDDALYQLGPRRPGVSSPSWSS